MSISYTTVQVRSYTYLIMDLTWKLGDRWMDILRNLQNCDFYISCKTFAQRDTINSNPTRVCDTHIIQHTDFIDYTINLIGVVCNERCMLLSTKLPTSGRHIYIGNTTHKHNAVIVARYFIDTLPILTWKDSPFFYAIYAGAYFPNAIVQQEHNINRVAKLNCVRMMAPFKRKIQFVVPTLVSFVGTSDDWVAFRKIYRSSNIYVCAFLSDKSLFCGNSMLDDLSGDKIEYPFRTYLFETKNGMDLYLATTHRKLYTQRLKLKEAGHYYTRNTNFNTTTDRPSCNPTKCDKCFESIICKCVGKKIKNIYAHHTMVHCRKSLDYLCCFPNCQSKFKNNNNKYVNKNVLTHYSSAGAHVNDILRLFCARATLVVVITPLDEHPIIPLGFPEHLQKDITIYQNIFQKIPVMTQKMIFVLATCMAVPASQKLNQRVTLTAMSRRVAVSRCILRQRLLECLYPQYRPFDVEHIVTIPLVLFLFNQYILLNCLKLFFLEKIHLIGHVLRAITKRSTKVWMNSLVQHQI